MHSCDIMQACRYDQRGKSVCTEAFLCIRCSSPPTRLAGRWDGLCTIGLYTFQLDSPPPPTRLVSPVVLRLFLLRLQAYSAGSNPPPWRGWMLALGLGAGGFAMAVLHHQVEGWRVQALKGRGQAWLSG